MTTVLERPIEIETNLPKRVTVSVRKEHIEGATPGNGVECPIARALHSMGYANYCVTQTGIYNSAFANRSVATLPRAARDFVITFDTSGKVEPFEFTVNL